MIEVSFVLTLPGWEVLTYFKGGRFETAPVVSWAIIADTEDKEAFIRVEPVTTSMMVSLDETPPVCSPDGDVTQGYLEKWPTIWLWLEDMQRREAEGKPMTTAQGVFVGGPAPLVLDNFRQKFQKRGEDLLS